MATKANKAIATSETRTINRSQIALNPCNPKRHTDAQIKQQVKNIKANGYLGGIVWNSRSGNLLDGHRRVQALDIINHYDGTPDTDYQLKVEVVDFDRKTELEQLTYMAVGNSKADYNLIAPYAADIDLSAVGLSDDDIAAIAALYTDNTPVAPVQDLGSSFLSPVYELEKKETDFGTIKEQRDTKPQMNVATVKEAKKAQLDRAADHHSTFQESILIRFNSEDDYADFCDATGYPMTGNLIIDGTELLKRLTG